MQQKNTSLTAVCVSIGILLATSSNAATAGVILSVGSKTINAGNSGNIDVFIHKEVGDADWNILLAGYSFSITPNAGAVGSLEFDAFQPDTEQSDARYLFSAFQPTGNFSGFASSVFQYDGGDSTNDLLDFATLSTVNSGDVLLAQLNVTHILPFLTPPSAAHGSTYTVSLIAGSDLFFDENFNQIAALGSSGTVTINGAAAVPEPSSLVIFASFAGLFGWRRIRRRS